MQMEAPFNMEPPPTSQTSSHFSLEPVSAAVLIEVETARRDAIKALGGCKTGIADLDEYVLLGGLERGCVVGMSAEEEEMGLLVSGYSLRLVAYGGARVPRTCADLSCPDSWDFRRWRTRCAVASSRGAWS